MGLFNIFKKPIIVNDEYIGTLRFVEFKDSTKDYFEGKAHFAPTDSVTEIFVQADRNGPTDEQREFYRDFQSNFRVYIEKIQPLIENEFRNWQENFIIHDFTKEFKLVCITIPRFAKKPLSWDLSFTTSHDKEHYVTIDFMDFEPIGVLIDG